MSGKATYMTTLILAHQSQRLIGELTGITGICLSSVVNIYQQRLLSFDVDCSHISQKASIGRGKELLWFFVPWG